MHVWYLQRDKAKEKIQEMAADHQNQLQDKHAELEKTKHAHDINMQLLR